MARADALALPMIADSVSSSSSRFCECALKRDLILFAS
jgi:hypothetical protein